MPSRGRSKISLNHVTAWLPKGLCSLENAFPMLSATVENCILAGSPDAALIQQEGADTVVNLKNRFTWSGDNNFYDRILVYWRISGDGCARNP